MSGAIRIILFNRSIDNTESPIGNEVPLIVMEYSKPGYLQKMCTKYPGEAIYSNQIKTGKNTESHINIEKYAVPSANEFG